MAPVKQNIEDKALKSLVKMFTTRRRFDLVDDTLHLWGEVLLAREIDELHTEALELNAQWDKGFD